MNIICKHDTLLHILLLRFLDYLLAKEYEFKITDSARTMDEHIAIYKSFADKTDQNWRDIITFNSKHLATYEQPDICRAIDFKVKLNGKYLSGLEIEELVKEYANICKLTYGIGVGKKYCHLDIRPRMARWEYNY